MPGTESGRPGCAIDSMAAAGRMTCPKGHECPDLLRVIRTLDLQDKDVLNVYIVGSHLWATCHKNSDWDLIVVVEKLSSRKPLNVHKGNFEAFVLSRSDYVSLVQDHSMQVLISLWLPSVCVLRETFAAISVFHFDKSSLLKALEHSKERDVRIAEKHFNKSDSTQARKVLLHCIRYLNLGNQIKDTGMIRDYTAANEFRAVVLECYSTEWKDLMSTVGPVIEQLWSEVTS